MKSTIIPITPRYAETDQMGVVHHANYLIYLELGRMSWLDTLGFSYDEMEKNGVLLPVYNIDITYRKPIRLNDEIFVKTTIKNIPTTRVEFYYEIIDQNDVLHASANLTLVFTDANSFRPRKPIPEFLEACKKLF
ncbi:4-hydroxybenzoyl-CoA thioesterase family activone site [Nonlabens tegetincola]|uniref:4-hydroxybenzoyl-CoA thioesterase family activone site n=1 Tax=Nonlabens tegetincola TaxID=323273 RepID=A0A090Q332_9FLAO|nr:thioesterase family protein [Nonlabens tegetincola]ARN70570.1 thioesterase [Nonlabens tegetincola]MEE2802671.1 thioesterase family protein [Bacteroidota bacterium]GAK97420.1 4-hydroxybenzoyl-CoA thioesterase family activone site [Nonlabens tegetincola]